MVIFLPSSCVDSILIPFRFSWFFNCFNVYYKKQNFWSLMTCTCLPWVSDWSMTSTPISCQKGLASIFSLGPTIVLRFTSVCVTRFWFFCFRESTIVLWFSPACLPLLWIFCNVKAQKLCKFTMVTIVVGTVMSKSDVISISHLFQFEER